MPRPLTLLPFKQLLCAIFGVFLWVAGGSLASLWSNPGGWFSSTHLKAYFPFTETATNSNHSDQENPNVFEAVALSSGSTVGTSFCLKFANLPLELGPEGIANLVQLFELRDPQGEILYQVWADPVEGRLMIWGANQLFIGIPLPRSKWINVSLTQEPGAGILSTVAEGTPYLTADLGLEGSEVPASLHIYRQGKMAFSEVSIWDVNQAATQQKQPGELRVRILLFFRLVSFLLITFGAIPVIQLGYRLGKKTLLHQRARLQRARLALVLSLGSLFFFLMILFPKPLLALFGQYPMGILEYPELLWPFQQFFALLGLVSLLFLTRVFASPMALGRALESGFQRYRYPLFALVLGGIFCLAWSQPAAPMYNVFMPNDPLYPTSALANMAQIHWYYIKPIYFLSMLGNGLITAFTGLILLPRLFDRAHWSIPLKLMAGFAIGYIAVVAITRLWALVFSGMGLYVLVLASLGTLAYFRRNELKRVLIHSAPTNLREQAFSLVFVAGALSLQLFQGDFFYAGHGNQYSNFVDQYADSALPIFGQHYDHILYNSFATKPFTGEYTALVSHWFTLGLMKLSVFWLFLVLFEHLKVPTRLAWVGTFFLFFGTSALYPANYYLQYDSSNPLFYIAYSGRAQGVVLAAVLITLKIAKLKVNPYAWGLLLLGAAALSISVGLWLVVLMVPLILPMPKDRLWLGILGAMILLSFGLPWTKAYIIGRAAMVLLVLLGLLRGFGVSRIYVRQGPNFFIGSAVLLFGLVTLGNLPSVFFLDSLNRVIAGPNSPEAAYQPITFNPVFTGAFAENGGKRQKIIWDVRDRGGWTVYHESLPVYLGTSGALLVFVVLFLFFRSRRDTVARYYFLLCLASLPLLYFFSNNVIFGNSSWPKTRLLEVPIYMIIFLGIYTLRQCPRWIKRFFLVYMLVFSILPFLANERIGQMYTNLKYIKYNYDTYR